jgi:type IV pilus assembly protein PilE
MDPMRTRQSGVTLMELLTVIVILGIISSIAVPSYRSYLMRTNRSDAKSALMQIQAAQEKFYIQNNKYTNKLKEAPPAGLGLPEFSANRYYKLSVTLDADEQGYSAKAEPTTEGGQSSDAKCKDFTLDDSGARSVSGTSDAGFCWK